MCVFVSNEISNQSRVIIEGKAHTHQYRSHFFCDFIFFNVLQTFCICLFVLKFSDSHLSSYQFRCKVCLLNISLINYVVI